MSVDLSLNLAKLNRRIEKLAGADPSELLFSLAVEGESQTRQRLGQDKHAPDGSAWPEWSESYAKTRHGGQSLLESQGELIDSLTADADSESAIWGSNLPYAAAQNFGYEKNNLAARQYLGFSSENNADIAAVMDDWIDDILGT